MKRAVAVAPILLVWSLVSTETAARPHPQLTAEAAAQLAQGILVVPADNLAVSLADHRSVPLIVPKPAQLALVADSPAQLLVVDGELYRVAAGKLQRAGGSVGRFASASTDGKVVASLSDAHTLTLSRDGHDTAVAYKRPVTSQWELVRPWVSPDGRSVLVTVRDYTQSLDTFDLVVVDVATAAFEEVHLKSKNFAPGDLRQSIDAGHVLIDLWLQEADDAGFVHLKPSEPSVFDLKTHQFSLPPAGLLLGQPVIVKASGTALSWRRGKMIYSDDKHCGGDQTLIEEAGQTQTRTERLVTNVANDDVVSIVDIVPDGSAAIVNVLTPKTCKAHGALVPLVGDDRVEKWQPFPLPARAPIEGRIFTARSP